MPNVVKGSKQHRMRVVPHRPLRRMFLPAIACLGLGAVAVATYKYGHYEGRGSRLTASDAAREMERLNHENDALQDENDRLQRQLVILEQARELDEHAAQELQATLSEQRNSIARLEQEALHYRQVVAEESKTTGLVVDGLDLDPTDKSGRYRYKLVMRQLDADGDSFLVGQVNVNIIGRWEGEQDGQDEREEEREGRQGDEHGHAVLPLMDLSEEVTEEDIRLRFRYFQNIEGELTLPDSFVPEAVRIHAVSTEPVAKQFSEDMGWGLAVEE